MGSKSKFLNKYLGLFHQGSSMNKLEHEVVHSGWMTKSPPERKLLGPWKLFRVKWKKRYFVLCKPSGSLPGQYELNYFSDQSCARKKGTIDLDQCEQIIESLDSDQFPFLLAIKTICKGRERTYFLATDTEDDMAKWVSNLCSVCGLKQEESPEDLPEPKKEIPKEKDKTPVVAVNDLTLPKTMTKVPVVTQPSSKLSSQLSTSESYIPLQECRTGSQRQSPVDRRESVDSVPDELAPLPPRTGQPNYRDSNDVFDSGLYSVPPIKTPHISFDEFYTVPPPSHAHRNFDMDCQDDLTYDVPPRRGSPSTPRSSCSGGADSTLSGGRPVTPQDLPTYDTPPTRPTPYPRQSSPQVPPSRPPRPSTSTLQQNNYQNLPTNSHAFSNNDLSAIIPSPPRGIDRPLISYDVPKPHIEDKRESNINIVPAPPKPCSRTTGNKHSYINAATGYVQNDDDMYLSMDKPDNSGNKHDSTYTDMMTVVSPPIPAPRPPETLVNNVNDLYVSPPTARSLPRPTALSRNPNSVADDVHSIWSTTRTKSFKKHQNGTLPSASSSTSSSVINSRPSVPSKSPAVVLPHRDGNISSDDEGLNPMQRIRGVQSIPPPPAEEKELKYLDLALEETNDRESVHMRSLPMKNINANSTPTEYREIDFVKTEALSNTKRWGDDQRQHEKHN
ncbi:hypothetical protein SNE40_016395 [Patella caerulea]|uniref:PH domain-containing protein n=1 Tax=Patella caerulea TaxID=87958 RepID=A0AAN8J9V9_PATCE